jgi:hypothetical protein
MRAIRQLTMLKTNYRVSSLSVFICEKIKGHQRRCQYRGMDFSKSKMNFSKSFGRHVRIERFLSHEYIQLMLDI